MGHERVGVLPKTKPWLKIAEQILSFEEGTLPASDIAAATLQNVRRRFQNIHEDPGVQEIFRFLCSLSSGNLKLLDQYGLDLAQNPSLLQIAEKLKHHSQVVGGSEEYRGIAARAAMDAIGWWAKTNGEPGLFGYPKANEIWANASTGAGFSTLSRKFFAKFTERYLNYFIDRVASAKTSSIKNREQLARAIGAHSEDIATHALESAQITQSFAAGWFNKHIAVQEPSTGSVRGFLAIAFGKLREELLREASARD